MWLRGIKFHFLMHVLLIAQHARTCALKNVYKFNNGICVPVTVHQNYVGTTADKLDPFILSVVLTDANNHSVLQYRAILWTKMVDIVITVIVFIS